MTLQIIMASGNTHSFNATDEIINDFKYCLENKLLFQHESIFLNTNLVTSVTIK